MKSHEEKTVKIINEAGPAGFTFFLMYIGAAIYFIHKTTGGFWDVTLAFLQAIVWPVYVIYHVLIALGA